MSQIYTFDSNIVSDLHKDAYGVRPKSLFWAEWADADDDGKQRIWDELIEDLKASDHEEKCQQQDAIAATEVLIQKLMQKVAGSTREDAIRFLDDAYDTGGDINFLEYHLGVPYGYLCGRIMGELLKPMVV
jgi:hypothetical protein